MVKLITILIFIISSYSMGAFGAVCFNTERNFSSAIPWKTEVNSVVNSYLKTFKIPGVVVLVGNRSGVLFNQAYGDTVKDGSDVETIYDIASITKLFTATSIMQLIENKKLYIGSKVKKVFPYHFSVGNKSKISIEDLLRHNSGFKAGVTNRVFTSDHDSTWDNILSIEPTYPHREFKYSDINYLLLGKITEKISKLSLNDYIRKNIFEPISMNNSSFLAYKSKRCGALCAPTRKFIKKGHVHDPTSFKLGGVAGHAGVFTTSTDLAKFASVFLNKGRYCNKQILSVKTIRKMTANRPFQSRGLGFDISSPYSVKPRGDYFAKGLSFGHTGYTGTSIWIDPSIDTFLIILSNSVYADNFKFAKKGYYKMVSDLANIVGKSNSI